METLSLFLGTRAGEAVGGRHRAVAARSASRPARRPRRPTTCPSSGGGLLRRLLLRPVGAARRRRWRCSALLAARDLLGDGRLMGGALLPAPADRQRPVADLHRGLAPGRARQRHRGAAVPRGARRARPRCCSAAPSAPSTCCCSPRSRWPASRPTSRCAGWCASVPLRVWGAVGYALLPPVLGAVATGRLGTAVARRAAAAAGARRCCARFGPDGAAGELAGRAGRPACCSRSMAAFVPMAWAWSRRLLAGRLALGDRADRPRAAPARGPSSLVPPVLLLPWLPALVAEPQLLLLEAGLPGPGLSEPDLDGLDLLLLHPGGPGLPPLVARRRAGARRAGRPAAAGRRRLVLLGWLVALARPGRRAGAEPDDGHRADAGDAGARLARAARAASPAPGWCVAAVAGAAGARARVAGASFGWRQPGRAGRAGAGRRRAGAHRRLVGRRPAPATRWSGGTRCCCRRSSPPRAPSRTGRAPWCCGSRRTAGCPTRCCAPTGPRTGDAELSPAARRRHRAGRRRRRPRLRPRRRRGRPAGARTACGSCC